MRKRVIQFTGKHRYQVRSVADADVMGFVCRVAPNLRVQPSVRIGEVDRKNWQSLVHCEEMREMIFGLLNLPVIRDIRLMAQFGRFHSLQLLQMTVDVVVGDLQFGEEFHKTKMHVRELEPQRTVPTFHCIVGSWAVIVVMVPERDFLCRQPHPLEVLMEAVDKVGNSRSSIPLQNAEALFGVRASITPRQRA